MKIMVRWQIPMDVVTSDDEEDLLQWHEGAKRKKAPTFTYKDLMD
jgi:hypothetical protein